MSKLFSELKRRNVVRVGIAYIVLAWVALQVADVMLDTFEAPAWVGKSFTGLVLLGFPFACLFAWAFELTPEGLKKTAEVDRSKSITHSTGRRLNVVIIVALVAALGYFVWDRQAVETSPQSTEPEKSIAVLPFVNMSSDQEQEWFADGLTEEILNALARTPDLLVASRTSSFQYKGRSEDVSKIAAALGVANILEGSVRRGGDRLRVTAQLIRASDGFHLWSDTFDRKPEDVIAIQENVAFEIAKALQTAMDPEQLKKMVSAGTTSVSAYEAYLEGLALTSRIGETGNVEDFPQALAAFDKAVALDPAFAAAHWHRAIYWRTELAITNAGSETSGLARERIPANYFEAIGAAIAGEKDQTRALMYSGDKAAVELRFADALRDLEKYVAAYPNDITGLDELIAAIAAIRDAGAGRKYLRRVAEISHDDPLTLNSLLNNLLFLGLVDDAVALARDVVARYPEHAFLVYQAHRILLWGGHVDEARELAEVLKHSQFGEGSIRLVELRQACAEKKYAEAQARYQEIMSMGLPDPSIPFIAEEIMGRPEAAHQLLIDAKLDVYALASFLSYPYFDHTRFPELAAAFERQGIDRPFISGPPYACAGKAPSPGDR